MRLRDGGACLTRTGERKLTMQPQTYQYGAARAISGTTLLVAASSMKFCRSALESVARLEAEPFTDPEFSPHRFGQADLVRLIRKAWPEFVKSPKADMPTASLLLDTGRVAHCNGAIGESICLVLLLRREWPPQAGATHRLLKVRTADVEGSPMSITTMQMRAAAAELSESEFDAQAATLLACIDEQGINEGLLSQPHLLVENAVRFPASLRDRSTRRLRDPDGVRAIVADRARAAIRNGEVEPFFAFPDEDDALYPRPRAQAAVPIYALSEEGRGGCEPELYLVLRLGIDPQSGALRIETPTVLMPWMMANNRTVLEGIRQRWRQDSYGRVA